MAADDRLPAHGARILSGRLAIALASAAGLLAGAAAPAPAEQFSPPAPLSGCAAEGAPHVVFPSEKPFDGTGPGAIVWSAGASCPGGAGARVDAIDAAEELSAPAVPRSSAGQRLAPGGPLSVAAGPDGQIALSGRDPASKTLTLTVQGSATGPFAVLARTPASAPPAAMSTAYLGDLAVAEVGGRGRRLSLQVERFFSTSLGPARASVAHGTDAVSALTVALDFRTDALLAWAQGGSLYARYEPAKGATAGLQRLGPAGPSPTPATLLSDDGRAIAMWTVREGAESSLYFDYSTGGVHFSEPRLVERVRLPAGADEQTPLLVRLSGESVMAAWGGVSEGRWVARTAPVDQRGLRTVSTLAAPGADLIPAALAPGPHDEAMLALAEQAPGSESQPGGGQRELLASRGIDLSPGVTRFAAPQLVAPAGTVLSPAIAIDPNSDRPVLAWRGANGAVEASVGSAGPAG